MNSFEDFVKSLFENSYFNLEEINKKKEEDKKELLNEIGWLLLVYYIEDGFLKIPKLTQNKLYKKFSNQILEMFSNETKNERAAVAETLKETLHKSSIFYNLEFKVGLNKDKKATGNLINKDAEKFINKKYKGETFSKRIWDNNNEIQKEIHYEIDKLLKGETSVNEIKKNIEDKFETSKFNAKRLVESEVARVHDEVFKKFCKTNDIDEVIYQATLCNTCKECGKDHNKRFKLSEAPQLPRHPFCKCYYIYDITIQSGGKYEKFSLKWFDDIENKANNFYEKTRNDNSDIYAISKNTGWKESAIKQIKNHVFYDKHKLENGKIDILDPDYDMAVAWSRLINGNYKDRDLLLLKHEYLESILEKKYNLTNKEAHDMTTKTHDWVSIMDAETGGGEDDPIYGTEK